MSNIVTASGQSNSAILGGAIKSPYFERLAKVGLAQHYVFNLENLLLADGVLPKQAITAATVTSKYGLVTLSVCTITGDNVGFYATGVGVGADLICLNYSTATQQNCFKARLYVQACGCEPVIQDPFLDNTAHLFAESELFDAAELWGLI
jgi:hypothetical protein